MFAALQRLRDSAESIRKGQRDLDGRVQMPEMGDMRYGCRPWEPGLDGAYQVDAATGRAKLKPRTKSHRPCPHCNNGRRLRPGSPETCGGCQRSGQDHYRLFGVTDESRADPEVATDREDAGHRTETAVGKPDRGLKGGLG